MIEDTLAVLYGADEDFSEIQEMMKETAEEEGANMMVCLDYNQFIRAIDSFGSREELIGMNVVPMRGPDMGEEISDEQMMTPEAMR